MPTKVCDFCGQPTDSSVCPHCQSDFSDNFGQLPDFQYVAPKEIVYKSKYYTNWVERVEQYKEVFYSEITPETHTFVDLGCGPNKFVELIKHDFPKIRATGYDQYALSESVITFDFENEKLPFKQKELDIILLSHVLEHLEKIHFVIESAIYSSKTVIIVLPNCLSLYSSIRAAIKGGLGGLYGLPLTPPKDRHRWIYTSSEMDRFIGYYAFKYNLSYKVIYLLHSKSIPIVSTLIKRPFIDEAIYVLRHNE
jgi:hypothetical protein